MINKLLFHDKRVSVLWLIIRLYVGWEWLMAGWAKVHNPLWVGSEAGKAIGGFLNGAIAKTGGLHPDVQVWYATFLESVVIPHPIIWSYAVAYGELLVGIALIIGLFTGVAAFFGAFMNFNYLLAGTVSINPILLLLSIGIMLAWRTAGFIGADYFLNKYFHRSR